MWLIPPSLSIVIVVSPTLPHKSWITQGLTVAALATLVYDIMITMDEEVALVWPYASPFYRFIFELLLIIISGNQSPLSNCSTFSFDTSL
jgi:hypothetical protein